MSRFDCSTKLVRDHWPRLLARFDRPGFVLLRDAFAMVGGELPYDAVLQVQAASFAGLESWARSVEAEGFRVEAVLTRRFETPLEV